MMTLDQQRKKLIELFSEALPILKNIHEKNTELTNSGELQYYIEGFLAWQEEMNNDT